MARTQRNRAPEPGIAIDIEGVRSNKKVADLTVEQFIQLLMQLVPQLLRVSLQHRVAATDRVLQDIRDKISRSSARERGELGKIVRSMQLAVIDQMPELIKQAARPSPVSKAKKPK